MKSARAAIAAAKNIVSFPTAKERREKDELAFLPAALEIVETPPSPTGRVIGATLIALFALALIWAMPRACRYCRFSYRQNRAERPG